jgi:hypothetical protein
MLKNAKFSPFGYLAAQLTSMGPLNALVWIPGLFALFGKRLKIPSLVQIYGTAYVPTPCSGNVAQRPRSSALDAQLTFGKLPILLRALGTVDHEVDIAH